MAAKAGFSQKKLINHSLICMMCNTLMQERISPNLVAQLLGHKKLSSLQHCSVSPFSQQYEMSDIFQ
jgi:hypothetical protein